MILFLLASAFATEPEPDAASSVPSAEPQPLALEAGPQILQNVEADYPPEALAAGLQATVRLQIELSETGVVRRVEVMEQQGHGFDEAAVAAVEAMQWAPARTAEGPIAVVFEFAYTFELRADPEQPAEAPINVDGFIRQMATRDQLAGVSVAIEGTSFRTTTDADGRFTFRGVPPGQYRLRLVHIGHVTENKKLVVEPEQVTELKLWLKADAYRSNELVAQYEPVQDEVTRRRVSIEEIRRIPGTFGDPVQVIQTLPGAARTPFGTGFLIIRGADPEDSGVYIDGIRVPIIYHLTGTTSVLAPDLIEGVEFLPGGYGPQYGRTHGGTINVQTKSEVPETSSLRFGFDLLDAQVFYQGRVGKKKRHGLSFGARRSYIDFFIPAFLDDGFELAPRYWDYQVKWTGPDEGDQQWSAFVYGFNDLLTSSTPDDFAQGPDQDTQGALRFGYGSHRALVNYRKAFNDDVRLEVTPSFGRDTTEFTLGQEFLLTTETYFGQARAEVGWKPSPAVEWLAGIDLWAAEWDFVFESAIQFDAFDDPLEERDAVVFNGQGTLLSPDAYLRANLRPLGGSDRWLLSPSVRANTYVLSPNGDLGGDAPLGDLRTHSLDPRLLSRYQLVPEKLTLKASTGLYHQPPQPVEYVALDTSPNIGDERGWSTSVGVEHRLSDAVRYDLDLFYRRIDNLVVFNDAFATSNADAYSNDGDGRAYGLEMILRHEPVNRFFGWISYTLSRSSRQDPAACEGERDIQENNLLGTGTCWFPFDFDQTHILSAQGGVELPRDFSVSSRIQYVTGNPATLFNTGIFDADDNAYNGFRVGSLNDGRLPPFFQTSVRLDKLWTFKRWQLNTYVDLLHVVRGVNAEFVTYNFDFTEVGYIRGLPFIPNIGLEARIQL